MSHNVTFGNQCIILFIFAIYNATDLRLNKLLLPSFFSIPHVPTQTCYFHLLYTLFCILFSVCLYYIFYFLHILPCRFQWCNLDLKTKWQQLSQWFWIVCRFSCVSLCEMLWFMCTQYTDLHQKSGLHSQLNYYRFYFSDFLILYLFINFLPVQFSCEEMPRPNSLTQTKAWNASLFLS